MEGGRRVASPCLASLLDPALCVFSFARPHGKPCSLATAEAGAIQTLSHDGDVPHRVAASRGMRDRQTRGNRRARHVTLHATPRRQPPHRKKAPQKLAVTGNAARARNWPRVPRRWPASPTASATSLPAAPVPGTVEQTALKKHLGMREEEDGGGGRVERLWEQCAEVPGRLVKFLRTWQEEAHLADFFEPAPDSVGNRNRGVSMQTDSEPVALPDCSPLWRDKGWSRWTSSACFGTNE